MVTLLSRITIPPDQRGEIVKDWILLNSLPILNDESPTGTNSATGNESTPDVSKVGKS